MAAPKQAFHWPGAQEQGMDTRRFLSPRQVSQTSLTSIHKGNLSAWEVSTFLICEMGALSAFCILPGTMSILQARISTEPSPGWQLTTVPREDTATESPPVLVTPSRYSLLCSLHSLCLPRIHCDRGEVHAALPLVSQEGHQRWLLCL